MTDPAAIRMLVLDVDGVMTDGSIVMTTEYQELKRYHVRDGFAMKLWMELGYELAVLTGRGGAAVTARMKDLGIKRVIEKSKDKGADLERLCTRAKVEPAATAFMGDDWPDGPAMRRAGYAIAPADASPEILDIAHFVTLAPGGHGAVREAVEHLLEARGQLAAARMRYDL